jgi:hypothetical protein
MDIVQDQFFMLMGRYAQQILSVVLVFV